MEKFLRGVLLLPVMTANRIKEAAYLPRRNGATAKKTLESFATSNDGYVAPLCEEIAQRSRTQSMGKCSLII